MKPVLLLVLLLVVAVLATAVPPPGRAAATTEPAGVWPLRPRPEVVHAFDPPTSAWGGGHRGVDLLGEVGQPVRAALPGSVSYAGSIAGVGIVVVDHGVTRTTYQPVTAEVRVGTEVRAGEVIGTLVWFGTHCLPDACLHWGLVEGETYLDPLTLVGGPSPVRLLPLDGSAPAQPVTPRPVLLGVLPGLFRLPWPVF